MSKKNLKTTAVRRALSVVMLGTAIAAAVPAVAYAKEIGSGTGGGGTTTACSPISSLSVRADATTSDTGSGSIQVAYGVKACTNGQALSATTTVAEYLDPSVVFYNNPAAPLNGKFTLYGVRTRVTYVVTITAYDLATGAVAGSQKAYVAAIPKGV